MAVCSPGVSFGATAAISCLTIGWTVRGAVAFAAACGGMAGSACSIAAFFCHQCLKLLPSPRLLDALCDEGRACPEGLVRGGALRGVTGALGSVCGMLLQRKQWQGFYHSVPGYRTEKAYWVPGAGLLGTANADGWCRGLQQCSRSVPPRKWQGLGVLVLQMDMSWHTCLGGWSLGEHEIHYWP
eukprot:1158537-Pelagomonas_calceolata.AAC.11